MTDLANLGQFLPLVLIFVVFYFLLIRPQQKKVASHKAMIDSVRRGDTVVTGGGLIGKVVKVIDEGTVQVELAENVRVRVVKGTLSDVRTRGEPGARDPGGKDTGGKDAGGKAETNGDAPANNAGGPSQKKSLLSRFMK